MGFWLVEKAAGICVTRKIYRPLSRRQPPVPVLIQLHPLHATYRISLRSVVAVCSQLDWDFQLVSFLQVFKPNPEKEKKE